MNTIVIPFVIDEDDVNTLDTAPVEIGSVERPEGLVVVPTRLELVRKAGTAYTVTRQSRRNDDYYVGIADEDLRYASVEPYLPSEELIVSVEESKRGGRGPVIFRVPAYELLARAERTCVVAFPETTVYMDLHETPGSRDTSLVFNIESLTGVTGGTGDIEGRLYLDEYPVG